DSVGIHNHGTIPVLNGIKNTGSRELLSPEGFSIDTMNTFNQIIRGILFLVLAIFGMIAAAIFMASTAIAVALLYVVARIKGRPFGVRAYWEERRKPYQARQTFRTKDVTDIEMREIPQRGGTRIHERTHCT